MSHISKMLQTGIICMLHIIPTHVRDYKRQKRLLPTFLRRLSKNKIGKHDILKYTNK